ncbi:hypothetical protein ACFL5K_03035 [Gemmatimonadota bacterium]
MAWKRGWTGLACACLVLLLCGSVLAQERAQRRRPGWQGPTIGAVVEDFELPLADGGTFKLSDQRGRILAIEMGACT